MWMMSSNRHNPQGWYVRKVWSATDVLTCTISVIAKWKEYFEELIKEEKSEKQNRGIDHSGSQRGNN